ncbi:MAG: MoaD/ThiS family protein [Actinocatenispora sp.]
MLTVLLPGVLRGDAGGAARLRLELPDQATLRTALDVLGRAHPRLERRLRDEHGCLRRYVNLYVDGEECRVLAGLDTMLGRDTEVQIIPSVAGG